MNRSFYTVIGAATVASLALASACVVEKVDTDNPSGSGASSNNSSSSSSATTGGNGGTGGTATGGQGGTGGSAACLTCSDFIQNGGNFPDELCGYDATQDACAAGSSCEYALDVVTCACGTDLASGSCADAAGDDSCATDFCAGNVPMGACAACINNACTASYNTCTGDI